MKRSYIRLLLFIMLASGIGWLVMDKVASKPDEKPGAEKSGPKSVLVTTHTVQPRTLTDTLTTIGSLKADESLEVKNEVPGKVVRIGFEEGERVRRGQVLLQMRNDTLRARLEVEKRRKNLLDTQVERQRKILETGGLSQQEFDVTANKLAVTKAELKRIRAEIERTTVRAPFSGIVGIRSVSPGAILTTGETVASLYKTDPIELEFTIPERYAGQIAEGQTVRFRLHGSDDLHSAKIHVLEPRISPKNRTLTAQAKTENPEGRLRPGAYAQVRVVLETIDDALTVPTASVTTSAKETSVWVSVDGKAEKRTIETGMRTENYVEVTKGLSAGDIVVVTGRQNVRPGAKLKVDDSPDAMNVDEIEPDPTRPGMRNEQLSEKSREDDAGSNEPDTPDSDAGRGGGQ